VDAVRRGSLASHGWFALELFDLEEYPTSGGASGLYLDVTGASKRKGASLIVWPAGGGDLVGACGVYTPASLASPGGGGGGWPAAPPANQLWRHDEASGCLESGLSAASSGGLVADVSRGSCEPGARLVTWTASGASNQVFEAGPKVALLVPAPAAAAAGAGASSSQLGPAVATAAAAAAAVEQPPLGGGALAVAAAGLLVELVCAGLPFDDHGRGRALVLGVRSEPAKRGQTSHNLPSHRVHGGSVGAGAEVVTVHPSEACSAADEKRPHHRGGGGKATGKFLTQWRVVPVDAALRPA
jgi:hypothetical protein